MINIIFSAIAAILFFLVPVIVGRAVIKLVCKKSFPVNLVSYFIIGSLGYYLLLLFFYYGFYRFNPALPLAVLIKIIIIGLLAISIPVNIINRPKKIPQLNNLLPVGAAFIFALAGSYIWQINSPYSFNWDMFEHQTLINTIIYQNKFSYFNSQISDTFGFNGYSSLFHSLTAASQAWLKIDILAFWQIMNFIQYFLVGFGSFVFTKAVTKNNKISYLTMVLSFLLLDTNISFTAHFFIPQTLSAMVFGYLLTQLFKHGDQKIALPKTLMLVSCLFLIISHYVIGIIAVAILFIIYIYFHHYKLIDPLLKNTIVIELLLIFFILGLLLLPSLPLSSINYGEAKDFTLSINQIFNYVRQYYGYLFLIFLPLGIVFAIKKRQHYTLICLIIMVFLLILIISPIPYALKFYVLGRYFIHLFIAIGIYRMIKRLDLPLMEYLAYLLLIIALIIIYITNISYWKSPYLYKNAYTNLSINEIKAADFLRQKYQTRNVMLISDPATLNILEPLSMLNSPGGAYMTDSNRKLLSSLNQVESTEQAAKTLYQLKDKLIKSESSRLLVMSGRYFVWQKQTEQQKSALSINIWQPVDLTLENKATISVYKTDSQRFSLVYSNPSLVIFEVVNK